jgi:hypothetical protein
VSFASHRVYGGAATAVGRLSVLGPYFVDATGQIVLRKSITAFTAPKRFATGREIDALVYKEWAASKGFTETREFSRVNWTGPPGPGVESGWAYDEAACEASIVAGAKLGQRVELVAHTYSSGDVAEMVDHLRRVDELCLRHDNAHLEVYNEPQQNGGHELVAEILRRYTPLTPGWSSGCYEPTPYPAGPSASYHSPRKDEWSRCFKDAWEFHDGSGPSQKFSPPFLGPVLLDEPPQVEQTIRDQAVAGWDPVDDWRAYGAGAAFFACGATLHGNPQFQKCEIPTDPTMLACVDAFIDGFSRVPVQRYKDYWRGDPPSSNPGSRRYFRWNEAGQKYQITVRPFAFGPV